jgi:hypothetical protein
MSNKKQSSVEWLIDQLEQKGDTWENASIRSLQISIDISDYFELKKQAKELHKQEIEDAFENGVDDEYEYHINVEARIRKKAEKYYNETFGGQDEK